MTVRIRAAATLEARCFLCRIRPDSSLLPSASGRCTACPSRTISLPARAPIDSNSPYCSQERSQPQVQRSNPTCALGTTACGKSTLSIRRDRSAHRVRARVLRHIHSSHPQGGKNLSSDRSDGAGTLCNAVYRTSSWRKRIAFDRREKRVGDAV